MSEDIQNILKKAIRILRQRDYDAFHKRLVNILKNSYAKSINKENLKFSKDLYDWDIIREEN